MPGKLDESNLMSHLMDHIKDNIYFMDHEGRIIKISQAGAEWLGFSSTDEVIGKTDLDLFTNEHGLAAYEDEQRIMQTGVPILGKEEKETWKDGHVSWVSTSKLPLRNDDGEVVGTFGISRDITAHKEAEIRAAALAEENRRFREDLEAELCMAAELQKTFFPTAYPDFSSIRRNVRFYHQHHTGGAVGGDFCSIRRLSATEVGIFLCDVMGHGVRAALGTAIVRAVVEEISGTEKDPGRYLTHMNRVLSPILRQKDQFIFTTAVYMVVDVVSGVVRLANAGHPVPIRMNAQARQAEWMVDDAAHTGAALTILEEFEYQTVERRLEPGDAVVLYTDGIYEVDDPAQEEFGEDRLLAAFSRNSGSALPDLFSAVLNEVSRFSSSGTFEDDVCLVGMHLGPAD